MIPQQQIIKFFVPLLAICYTILMTIVSNISMASRLLRHRIYTTSTAVSLPPAIRTLDLSHTQQYVTVVVGRQTLCYIDTKRKKFDWKRCRKKLNVCDDEGADRLRGGRSFGAVAVRRLRHQRAVHPHRRALHTHTNLASIFRSLHRLCIDTTRNANFSLL